MEKVQARKMPYHGNSLHCSELSPFLSRKQTAILSKYLTSTTGISDLPVYALAYWYIPEAKSRQDFERALPQMLIYLLCTYCQKYRPPTIS